MDCWQVWGGAFTPKSPFEVGKNRGNRTVFIYVKRAKAKNNVISYIGVARDGMTNASNLKWGFTPDSNPKRGNTKMGNTIEINLS